MTKLNKVKAILGSESTSQEEKENAILSFGDSGSRDAIPFLMELLNSELGHKGLRDCVAMTLADLGANQAMPKIMQYIKDPLNENYRESLVYAMSFLDCHEYFLDFVEIFCTANYMSKLSASDIIKRQSRKVDRQTLKIAIRILTDHLQGYKTGTYDYEDQFLSNIRFHIDQLRLRLSHQRKVKNRTVNRQYS